MEDIYSYYGLEERERYQTLEERERKILDLQEREREKDTRFARKRIDCEKETNSWTFEERDWKRERKTLDSETERQSEDIIPFNQDNLGYYRL